MDNQELNDAWEKVCITIKSYDSIESSQVEAFFSRLKPQAMSPGFLMLTADNEFIRTWVGTHYLNIIKDALFNLYDTNFNVLIEVDPTQVVQAPQPINTTQQQDNQNYQKPPMSAEEEPITTKSESFSTYSHQTQTPVQETKRTTTQGEIRNPAGSPLSSLTFENFVIGNSNRLAYSMAVAVAERPGINTGRNPLFIYGKSGLGKTHLLRAIQNYVQINNPEMSVIYVDSNELVSAYTEASVAHDKEKSSFKNFKQRYEEADVLLIDDVQSLQGKKQTLEIVFQIFNNLVSKGCQVVLSADRAPKNIDIDERYQSRFNSGFTTDIQPPEVETKLGIIRGFIDEYRFNENNPNFSIDENIQLYIAENSGSNVRELKSAVTKVIGQITFFNQPDISLSEVKRLLENHFSSGAATRITVTDVQKAVESFYKVSHSDLISKKRTREIAFARQVSFYLCRQLTDLPYEEIGKQFNKDHTTVMHGEGNIEQKLKENRELREEIEILVQNIREL